MKDEAIGLASSNAISQDTLRAFAKGQLDEATEQQVLALLDTRPDLAAQVAAISSDSMLEKMKSHGQPAAPISLASQLTSDNQEQSDAKSTKTPLNTPPELAELTDYKILKEIGRGGMGVVYLAEHLLTGRKEVLKVLNERLMTNPEARKRFDQEIKCIAAMNHETIVRCYTVQQLPSAIVLCMEYVPGTNLHQFIHTNGPLPIHVACGIAAEVCRGLQHAMDNGLVHRDIKPSNIMLYKAEGKIKAKILDFGLARLNTREKAQGLTDDGTLLGTLEYIAPEQCLNAAAADIRSDIYSLGCTLYHMLVGHPPFSGSSGELILAHAQSVPPAINLARPEVPSELAGVISKMLAKQPGQRQQKPLDVADDLAPFVRRQRASQVPSHPPATPYTNSDTSVELHSQSNTTVQPKPTIEPKPSVDFESSLLPQIKPSPKRKRRFPKKIIFTAVAFVFLALLGLYSLNVKTKHGTLLIKNLPDKASVTVDDDEVKIERLPQGDAVVRVKPGSRQVEVVADGVTVIGQTVSIESGKQTPIEISLEPQSGTSALEVAADGKAISAGPTKLPDISHFISDNASFHPLIEKTDEPFKQFHRGDTDVEFDDESGVVILSGGEDEPNIFATLRSDFRNFHLRLQVQIDSIPKDGNWNQKIGLRVKEFDKLTSGAGWRFALSGNAYHPGLMHTIKPFGAMFVIGVPYRGNATDFVGRETMGNNQIMLVSADEKATMSRDEFHYVEYIAHGATIESFLDGKFMCSVADRLDRTDQGHIAFYKRSGAVTRFREFSILELGPDELADRYAESMALQLSTH